MRFGEAIYETLGARRTQKVVACVSFGAFARDASRAPRSLWRWRRIWRPWPGCGRGAASRATWTPSSQAGYWSTWYQPRTQPCRSAAAALPRLTGRRGRQALRCACHPPALGAWGDLRSFSQVALKVGRCRSGARAPLEGRRCWRSGGAVHCGSRGARIQQGVRPAAQRRAGRQRRERGGRHGSSGRGHPRVARRRRGAGLLPERAGEVAQVPRRGEAARGSLLPPLKACKKGTCSGFCPVFTPTHENVHKRI